MSESLTDESTHMRRFRKSWSYSSFYVLRLLALVSLAEQSDCCGIFIVSFSSLLRLWFTFPYHVLSERHLVIPAQ